MFNYNKSIKKICLFCVSFCLINFSTAFAKEAVFTLSPVQDGILLATGLGLELTSFCISEPEWDKVKNDKSDVNSFDKNFMYKYNETLDSAGDLLFATLAAGQLALTFTAEKEEWLPVMVMAAETVLITDGTKRILKNVVERERPYTYFDDPSSASDAACSWPSGHSMNGFALASFSSYVFWQYYPESPMRWAVAGGAFGIAGITAFSRVAAGCHFVSDVASGAVMGAAIGFLVPYLHRRATISANKKSFVDVALLPGGFSCKINY